MSHESLPMSCPGNTRSKSLKPMKYDMYSSTMFKLCYFSHLAVGGKREDGAKKGIASVHTHFQRMLGVHELQKHHQKLALILRHPHLYSCHNVQITYIAALCNWPMKTGLELESPVLKASSWISLFLAWKDLCRPWCIILWIHSLIRNSSTFSHVDNRPFASNGKTKRKLSVI